MHLLNIHSERVRNVTSHSGGDVSIEFVSLYILPWLPKWNLLFECTSVLLYMNLGHLLVDTIYTCDSRTQISEQENVIL